MKICQVITRLIVGGAQENTVLTCRGLVEKGHNVTLVAGPETGPEGSLWDQARASGCALVELNSLRRAVRLSSDARARSELKRLFLRLRPDVVHTHSSKAGILGRSAAAAARVPMIVHTIHGMSFNRTQARPVRALYRAAERRAARQTTALIAVADAMIDQAVRAGLARRDRFVTIRSGLETDRFARDDDAREESRRAWEVGQGDVVVGTIARLFENKGYEEILRAMRSMVTRVANLRFVWVGDGRHGPRYKRELERLGFRDRVRFTGLVAPERIGSVLNGFDILLHSSRWEGLPRAIVQALLTEVPVVSFDNDGAPEVVNSETGVLVRYGDVEGLADGVTELAQDPRRRRALGLAGRRQCLAAYDWRRMVDAIEELYHRLRRDICAE